MTKKKYIIFGILLYLLSAIASYGIFSFVRKPASQNNVVSSPLPKDASGKITFDENLPKTESCPLTGQLFSREQRTWWEKHRPLGIMIENHEEARPQSGLSAADIVYEAVAEGGITRFLAIFYCQDGGMVGPVRSARTYYLDFISEYGDKPLYAHVGGANAPGPADALGQIRQYGWELLNDLSQFNLSFPTYWKDSERLTKNGEQVATEHQMYSTTEKLWKAAEEKRELTNVDEDGVAWDKTFIPWQFKDDAKEIERGTASPSFDFWKGYKEYSVTWEYEKTGNSYRRSHGGQPHTDKNNDKQIVAKNIVIVFMAERSLNDEEKHLLYTTKGRGRAIFFFDGQAIEGSWEKKDRVSRMTFLDKNGKAVKLNRGQIWIEVVPLGNDVSY